MLTTLVEAISDAGYTPGRGGIAIALDPAASEFYRKGAYHVAGKALSNAQLVGDDIFVTNAAIIRDAISRNVGNAALIKVNQIGTVTETLEALAVCRQAGYAAMISHGPARPRTPSSPISRSDLGAES